MAAKSTNTKKVLRTTQRKQQKMQQLRKHRQRKKLLPPQRKVLAVRQKNFKSYKYSTKSGNPFRDSSIGFLAICILLILSNFGMGGIAGGAISSVGFGLVGAMAYLFPFVFFGAVAFYISNKGNPHAYIK